MERIHPSHPYLGNPELSADGGEAPASPPTSYARYDRAGISTAVRFRILDIVISSRNGYLSGEPGPLPKNYLNPQLHRCVGSRLVLQLFVVGFSAAGWEFI